MAPQRLPYMGLECEFDRAYASDIWDQAQRFLTRNRRIKELVRSAEVRREH